MYIIGGIVVGALVFALWTRVVRGDDQSEADSRDMSYYPDSIYSVLKDKTPVWLGGSGSRSGTSRSHSAFNAPTSDVIVARNSRHSMHARHSDDPNPPRQFPRSTMVQSGFVGEHNSGFVGEHKSGFVGEHNSGSAGVFNSGSCNSGSFNSSSSGRMM